MRKLIVGSRRSKLALTQSQQFIDKLKFIDPSLDIEIKEIVTKGDKIVINNYPKLEVKDFLLRKSKMNYLIKR